MNRRDAIRILGGAALAWPFCAHAQRRLPIIGYLGASTQAAEGYRAASVVQRLRELGWVEGSTATIEYRWADNRAERYGQIAAEFVAMKVDVIVALGITVPAIKKVTAAVPVVFTVDADPIANGLVESLARPGANVTGLSTQAPDLAGKRLELLREVIPTLSRLAVLTNVAWPGAVKQALEVQVAAPSLDLMVTDRLDIRKSEDIAGVFAALKGGAQAVYVCGDPVTNASRFQINALAINAKLPTMFVQREYIGGGGLMSYGPNLVDLFRRAGDFVDKILRGTKPADIPVEQPTKFELVINLTTAKALGLKIPEAFLLRADEVIE